MATNVPLPEPDGVTLHQPALLEAVQLEFDVTVKLVLPADEVTFWFEGDTASVAAAPACVTVTVEEGNPETVTVMVAIRCDVVVFAW